MRPSVHHCGMEFFSKGVALLHYFNADPDLMSVENNSSIINVAVVTWQHYP